MEQVEEIRREPIIKERGEQEKRKLTSSSPEGSSYDLIL